MGPPRDVLNFPVASHQELLATGRGGNDQTALVFHLGIINRGTRHQPVLLRTTTPKFQGPATPRHLSPLGLAPWQGRTGLGPTLERPRHPIEFAVSLRFHVVHGP